MLTRGQTVLVINDKGIAYRAEIIATAKDDEGRAAYKVVLQGMGGEHLGQWHKACDVFLEEESLIEEEALWTSILKS